MERLLKNQIEAGRFSRRVIGFALALILALGILPGVNMAPMPGFAGESGAVSAEGAEGSGGMAGLEGQAGTEGSAGTEGQSGADGSGGPEQPALNGPDGAAGSEGQGGTGDSGDGVFAAPHIGGPEEMSLTEGYEAVSTEAYTVEGNPAPVVGQDTNYGGMIVWNDETKRLDIAAGLAEGTYPVTLTAENSVAQAELAFALTVEESGIRALNTGMDLPYDEEIDLSQTTASGAGYTVGGGIAAYGANPGGIVLGNRRLTFNAGASGKTYYIYQSGVRANPGDPSRPHQGTSIFSKIDLLNSAKDVTLIFDDIDITNAAGVNGTVELWGNGGSGGGASATVVLANTGNYGDCGASYIVNRIRVPRDAALTIESIGGRGSTEGAIVVGATSDRGAGIGGVYSASPDARDAGKIVINGGTIEATGHDYGAGIGGAGGGSGAYLGGSVSSLIVNGGRVTANGAGSGAGIGGGGSQNAAGGGGGIGAGNVSSILITGGEVIANSGAGNGNSGGAAIGGGGGGQTGGRSGTITIQGGKVTANSNSNRGAGIGSGAGNGETNGGQTDSVTITGGEVTATGGKGGGAGIGGAYGSAGTGASALSPISGQAAGINITGGKITVTGGFEAGGSAGGAAIGGGANGSGGDIYIGSGSKFLGGTNGNIRIEAGSGAGGAAIGGGAKGSGGTIAIGSKTSGIITVSAAGGSAGGAAIGGGAGGAGGTIAIVGRTAPNTGLSGSIAAGGSTIITATGGDTGGAAIGGGAGGSGGAVRIDGAVVTAKGGLSGGAGIGGGAGNTGAASLNLSASSRVSAYASAAKPAIDADASGNAGDGYYVNAGFDTAISAARETSLEIFADMDRSLPPETLTLPAGYRCFAYTTGVLATGLSDAARTDRVLAKDDGTLIGIIVHGDADESADIYSGRTADAYSGHGGGNTGFLPVICSTKHFHADDEHFEIDLSETIAQSDYGYTTEGVDTDSRFSQTGAAIEDPAGVLTINDSDIYHIQQSGKLAGGSRHGTSMYREIVIADGVYAVVLIDNIDLIGRIRLEGTARLLLYISGGNTVSDSVIVPDGASLDIEDGPAGGEDGSGVPYPHGSLKVYAADAPLGGDAGNNSAGAGGNAAIGGVSGTDGGHITVYSGEISATGGSGGGAGIGSGAGGSGAALRFYESSKGNETRLTAYASGTGRPAIDTAGEGDGGNAYYVNAVLGKGLPGADGAELSVYGDRARTEFLHSFTLPAGCLAFGYISGTAKRDEYIYLNHGTEELPAGEIVRICDEELEIYTVKADAGQDYGAHSVDGADTDALPVKLYPRLVPGDVTVTWIDSVRAILHSNRQWMLHGLIYQNGGFLYSAADDLDKNGILDDAKNALGESVPSTELPWPAFTEDNISMKIGGLVPGMTYYVQTYIDAQPENILYGPILEFVAADAQTIDLSQTLDTQASVANYGYTVTGLPDGDYAYDGAPVTDPTGVLSFTGDPNDRIYIITQSGVSENPADPNRPKRGTSIFKRIVVKKGAFVTLVLDDIDLAGRIEIEEGARADLILENTREYAECNASYIGDSIIVPAGGNDAFSAKLNIEKGESAGALNVSAAGAPDGISGAGGNAGIGGLAGGGAGSIAINSGTVTATGAGGGAGIGGGRDGAGGRIQISGGSITATGGNGGGAGIGGGNGGAAAYIAAGKAAEVKAYSSGTKFAVDAGSAGNQGDGYFVNAKTAGGADALPYKTGMTLYAYANCNVNDENGQALSPSVTLSVPAEYVNFAYATGETAGRGDYVLTDDGIQAVRKADGDPVIPSLRTGVAEVKWAADGWFFSKPSVTMAIDTQATFHSNPQRLSPKLVYQTGGFRYAKSAALDAYGRLSGAGATDMPWSAWSDGDIVSKATGLSLGQTYYMQTWASASGQLYFSEPVAFTTAIGIDLSQTVTGDNSAGYTAAGGTAAYGTSPGGAVTGNRVLNFFSANASNKTFYIYQSGVRANPEDPKRPHQGTSIFNQIRMAYLVKNITLIFDDIDITASANPSVELTRASNTDGATATIVLANTGSYGLCDASYLVNRIQAQRGTELTIESMRGPGSTDGALVVSSTSDNAAAIGGIEGGEGIRDAGKICINGGTIHATAGDAAANSAGGAAGIGGGGGVDGGSITSLTINGGKVTAIGRVNAAGIGGGGGYTNGGGGGMGANNTSSILITGGEVVAVSGPGASRNNITNNTPAGGAGIGGGGGIERTGRSGAITITGGKVTANCINERGAGIGGGATGNASGGIVDSITVTGGEVTATSIGGAAIGGAFGSAGPDSGALSPVPAQAGGINITGGRIKANSDGGAAIGGGANAAGGDIYIGSGSTAAGGANSDIDITAHAGSGGGAGIGGGNGGGGGRINIGSSFPGGTAVTATGGSGGGAGIGGGRGGSAAELNLSAYARVMAYASADKPAVDTAAGNAGDGFYVNARFATVISAIRETGLSIYAEGDQEAPPEELRLPAGYRCFAYTTGNAATDSADRKRTDRIFAHDSGAAFGLLLHDDGDQSAEIYSAKTLDAYNAHGGKNTGVLPVKITREHIHTDDEHWEIDLSESIAGGNGYGYKTAGVGVGSKFSAIGAAIAEPAGVLTIRADDIYHIRQSGVLADGSKHGTSMYREIVVADGVHAVLLIDNIDLIGRIRLEGSAELLLFVAGGNHISDSVIVPKGAELAIEDGRAGGKAENGGAYPPGELTVYAADAQGGDAGGGNAGPGGNAAIGGASGTDGGSIIVRSGVVTATGGAGGGAGIGAGAGGSGAMLTIYEADGDIKTEITAYASGSDRPALDSGGAGNHGSAYYVNAVLDESLSVSDITRLGVYDDISNGEATLWLDMPAGYRAFGYLTGADYRDDYIYPYDKEVVFTTAQVVRAFDEELEIYSVNAGAGQDYSAHGTSGANIDILPVKLYPPLLPGDVLVSDIDGENVTFHSKGHWMIFGLVYIKGGFLYSTADDSDGNGILDGGRELAWPGYTDDEIRVRTGGLVSGTTYYVQSYIEAQPEGIRYGPIVSFVARDAQVIDLSKTLDTQPGSTNYGYTVTGLPDESFVYGGSPVTDPTGVLSFTGDSNGHTYNIIQSGVSTAPADPNRPKRDTATYKRIVVESGASVTLVIDDIDIAGRIELKAGARVKLILENTGEYAAYGANYIDGGILVPAGTAGAEDAELRIARGKSDAALRVRADSGAAIGGGAAGPAGRITIDSGTVGAVGGAGGAAIGGGAGGAGGRIVINGGAVTATGGIGGAAIGGGPGGTGGAVSINGGTVTATGGAGGGAGIGGGTDGAGGRISVNGGTVEAKGGADGGSGIGGGTDGAGADLNIGAAARLTAYSKGTDTAIGAAARETSDIYYMNARTVGELPPVQGLSLSVYAGGDKSGDPDLALTVPAGYGNFAYSTGQTAARSDYVLTADGKYQAILTAGTDPDVPAEPHIPCVNNLPQVTVNPSYPPNPNDQKCNFADVKWVSGWIKQPVATQVAGGTAELHSEGQWLAGALPSGGAGSFAGGGFRYATQLDAEGNLAGNVVDVPWDTAHVSGWNGWTEDDVTAKISGLTQDGGSYYMQSYVNVYDENGTAQSRLVSSVVPFATPIPLDLSQTTVSNASYGYTVSGVSAGFNGNEIKKPSGILNITALDGRYYYIYQSGVIPHLEDEEELKSGTSIFKEINITGAADAKVTLIVDDIDLIGRINLQDKANVTLLLANSGEYTSDRGLKPLHNKISGGIRVVTGRSLTIDSAWDRNSGSTEGKLVVTNSNVNCAGIGGGHGSYDSSGAIGTYGENAGTITINGGTIRATGGRSNLNNWRGGAGIGGGGGTCHRAANTTALCMGGTITINGGDVEAAGQGDAAGIGGGGTDTGVVTGGAGAGSITINGGTVRATSGTGDTYYRVSGAGIGGGSYQYGGNITINGGRIYAKSLGVAGAGIGGGNWYNGGVININGGYIEATGADFGAGIGGGGDSTYTESHGGNITITDGTVKAVSGAGSAASGGIGGAGIGGGGLGQSGTIVISGGTVDARSGNQYGAGIGAGSRCGGGSVTISGGEVTAAAVDGAAIGSGSNGTVSNLNYNGWIYLTGGKVTATASGNGAGIGRGRGTSNGYGTGMYLRIEKEAEVRAYASGAHMPALDVAMWSGGGNNNTNPGDGYYVNAWLASAIPAQNGAPVTLEVYADGDRETKLNTLSLPDGYRFFAYTTGASKAQNYNIYAKDSAGEPFGRIRHADYAAHTDNTPVSASQIYAVNTVEGYDAHDDSPATPVNPAKATLPVELQAPVFVKERYVDTNGHELFDGETRVNPGWAYTDEIPALRADAWPVANDPDAGNYNARGYAVSEYDAGSGKSGAFDTSVWTEHSSGMFEIPAEENFTMYFVYSPAADVLVSNSVKGAGEAGTKTASYTVSFTDVFGTPIPAGTVFGYTGGTLPGAQTGAPAGGSLTTDKDGSAVFSLTDGQTIRILDVPAELRIRVRQAKLLLYTTYYTSRTYDVYDTDFETVLSEGDRVGKEGLEVGRDTTSRIMRYDNREFAFENARGQIVEAGIEDVADSAEPLLNIALVVLVVALAVSLGYAFATERRRRRMAE